MLSWAAQEPVEHRIETPTSLGTRRGDSKPAPKGVYSPSEDPAVPPVLGCLQKVTSGLHAAIENIPESVFFFFLIFINLTVPGLSCSMWDPRD